MQAAQLIVEQREKIEIYDLYFPDVQRHSNVYADSDTVCNRREEAEKQWNPLFGERSEIKSKSGKCASESGRK